jgi:Domain of unknown function (DUF4349)
MPAPPEPGLDVRHWDLAEKLRAAPPRPSDDLRERVRAISLTAPSSPRRRDLPPQRLALLLAPVALAVVAGVAVGLRGSDDSREVNSDQGGLVLEATPTAPVPGAAIGAPRGAGATLSKTFAPGANRRLQQYQAELRVRVPDLNRLGEATQQAMRTTRSLGGYVALAEYGAPTRRNGESLLVVRVPVGRVQQAIFRFADLGAIVSQRIRIQDLQAGFNALERRILSLRQRIARLEARLADPATTPEQRARLRVQLLANRKNLAAALRSREATLRLGRLARIDLTLTTRREAAAAPSQPGYVERTLGDALELVGKALVWILYGAIVAAPFLLLGLLVWLGERARRRRSDERLLENA